MVHGSNESLYSPDEELDLNLRTGTPLQKSFEKVDVNLTAGSKVVAKKLLWPKFEFFGHNF